MKYLIWDFDGTLGCRVDGWTGAVLAVIRQKAPEHQVTPDEVRPHLQAGYPWHTPYQPHLEITSPDQWWNALALIFEKAFKAIGIDGTRARVMARQVRHIYTDSVYWRLFDDTVPALAKLSSQGWTHIVLSNHVPELQTIVGFLQLKAYIARIFNSAETGYEKPHPQAFWNVLQAIGEAQRVWMIGDSMNADIAGAAAVGIDGILVRNHHQDAKYCCHDLLQVPAIINRK